MENQLVVSNAPHWKVQRRVVLTRVHFGMLIFTPLTRFRYIESHIIMCSN